MAQKRFNIEDISGGTQQNRAMSGMPDNSFLLIRNMEYDKTGALVSRGGQVAYNGAAIAGTMDNAIRFYRPSTAAKTLIVSADLGSSMRTYSGNDATGVFTEITGGSALTTAQPVEFAAYKDYLLIVNGTETMQCWQSGASKATCVFSSFNPKGKYIAVANERVFVAGLPAELNRIRFSAVSGWTAGPTTDFAFDTNDYIDVPTEENDRITGVVSFNDYIFVAMTKRWFRLLGTESVTTMVMQEVRDVEGCIGQRAMTVTPDGILYVSPSNNIWLWNPNTENPINVGLMAQDTISDGVLTGAACGYYPGKKHGLVSFKQTSASTYNDYSITVDFSNNQKLNVFESSNMGASAFVSNDGNGDNNYFYRLAPDTSGAAQGVVYRMDTGNQDAGASFTCTLYTKHYNMQDPDLIKSFRHVRFACNAQTDTTPFSVVASIDRGRLIVTLPAVSLFGFNYWGSFTYGAASYGGGQYQTGILNFPTAITGKECQLQFTKTDGNPLIYHSFGIEFDDWALIYR